MLWRRYPAGFGICWGFKAYDHVFSAVLLEVTATHLYLRYRTNVRTALIAALSAPPDVMQLTSTL